MLLAECGGKRVSRKGNCWDTMESFFNNLKNKRVFHEGYATREEAKRYLF